MSYTHIILNYVRSTRTIHQCLANSQYFTLQTLDFIPACGYNTDMSNIYSVNEAAQKLGLDSSQVRRLLRKGEIESKRLGRDWVVLSLDYKRKRKPKTNVVKQKISKKKEANGS
jgi:excisionase family DNA binding protein